MDERGHIFCSDEGRQPGGGGGGGGGGEGGGGGPPPLRYLRSSFDPVVGTCWLWSSSPPGWDSWDPANDAAIIAFRLAHPQCPGTPAGPGGPAPSIPDYAWSVFRSFPLAAPQIALQPAGAGITGLPSYVSVAPAPPIEYSEVLPNGRLLEVQAEVSSVSVEWGDGTRAVYPLADLAPYPDGAATHSYVTKTCSVEERARRPAGLTCHPSLAAYPVTVVFSWTGSYRYGAGWVQLGGLDRAASVDYDVDEVVGVLEP